MPGFFDRLVATAAAEESVDAATAGRGPADREAVRVGAVMASVAVVAELARRAEAGTDGPGSGQLEGDGADAGFVTAETLFGNRAGLVAAAIARDAPLERELAESLLGFTVRLASAQLDRLGGDDRAALRTERHALAAAGWDTWLADTTADTAAAADVDTAPGDEVSDLVMEEPEPEPEPAAELDGPLAITAVTAARQDRRPGAGRRRWIGVGVVALLAVAASTALVIAGGGPSGDRVDNSPAATGPAPSRDPGDDGPAGTSTELDQAAATASSPPAVTIPPGPPSPSSPIDPGGLVGPATYQLALADPTGGSDAAGTARIDLEPAAGQVCYRFQVAGLEEPFAGHIHAAAVGESGGITVDFSYLTGDAPSGCVQSFPADVAELIRHPERHYVELHDPEYGFGIRGRLAAAAPGAGASDLPAAGGAGAMTALVGGRVVLRGDVPDEAARAALLAGTADLVAQGVAVVDELVVRSGAPAPSGRVVVDDPILFPFDSTVISGDTAQAVERLARILRLRPTWRATLVGNTDGTGDVVYNLVLSLRRAIAVRHALVAAGAAPETVTIRGDGQFAPVADNATPGGRSRNRRIELEISAP